MEIKKARKLHKGTLELLPPRIGEIDVAKESSDFSFEYRDSHDFSRAIRICVVVFFVLGGLFSHILW